MDKETLKKLWKNKRTHSLMVLIIWIVSLGLLMGVVTIMSELSPRNKNEIPKVEEKTTTKSKEEKLHDLQSDEYKMIFLVTAKDNTFKYEGTEQNDIVSGYKEDQTGIKKYRIENGKIYEIVLDQTTEINGIYENVLENLLNREKLIDLLLENREKNVLLYQGENLKVNIEDNKEEIEIIGIESDTTTYEFIFEKNKNVH